MCLVLQIWVNRIRVFRFTVHPSSTCFRWQFLPPSLRLAWLPLNSVLFNRKPLISTHSLVRPSTKPNNT
ncbi:hypothetical protein VNO78_03022 [Psophocarpus tetragonolobus]|uniref:Uncharacterized protein n=1 Tax=Psophocarpus tetragonolobus TaxID=3891 RepID=A0AAN9XW85_PSOTE